MRQAFPAVSPTKLQTLYSSLFFLGLLWFSLTGLGGCQLPQANTIPETLTALEEYIVQPDPSYTYELVNTVDYEGYTIHILRMTSQQWLTQAEVRDVTWWHWVTIVVPDSVQSSIGLLYIGSGDRQTEQPSDASPLGKTVALSTHSIVTEIHNIPNQPIEFVGDDFGPRYEDEMIAYAWRQYLEAGAHREAAVWLPQLPMTKAIVRAMDTVSEYSADALGQPVDRFVVAGASKRGWTSWLTAVVDERAVALAPMVIDMLNVVPSFHHHWQAYGQWAPAVGAYEQEGIMDWQNSAEYQCLMATVEPYSYRKRLTLPKLLLNATGDQFFLPDSWRFYWSGLVGEKQLRYLPNTGHSLEGTDFVQTLTAFLQVLITETPCPTMDWDVVKDELVIHTDPANPPTAVTLWQASNSQARDFRIDTIGEAWTAEDVPVSETGHYQLTVNPPSEGWRAFLVEFTFPTGGEFPLKLTTGVVVVPDTLPYAPFESNNPKGHPSADCSVPRTGKE